MTNPEGLQPGTLVGDRYELTRQLAIDPAGHQFWQARDTVLSRDMAVTILPGMGHTSTVVTRTLRLGRLTNDSLPAALDVGTITHGDTATAYIVGQWVEGSSLADLMVNGPLPVATAATLIVNISQALSAAHGNGIVLGWLHPALIRISPDGSIRISHAIAQAGGSEEQDIRLSGGLLYFMLTASWPLSPAETGTPGLPAAEISNGRVARVDEVNPQVPDALAILVLRLLYPSEPKGIRSIDTVAALLGPQPAAVIGDAATQSQAAIESRRVERAEERLHKERRIKLGIAGGMLLVFASLIVVIVATLTNQFMDSIAEPIRAADQQSLVDAPTHSTTRTVGSTTAPTEPTATDDSDQEPTDTTDEQPAPVGEPVTVVNAEVYDPQGEPPADYENYVDQAYDGDPATEWPTWVYKQQFGPGGIKDGVGLVLDFGKPITPTDVAILTGTPGTDVEIRSASSATPALDDTAVLAQASVDDDPVSLTLADAPESQYLLVWITKLAPYESQTDSSNSGFASSLAEISVSGY